MSGFGTTGTSPHRELQAAYDRAAAAAGRRCAQRSPSGETIDLRGLYHSDRGRMGHQPHPTGAQSHVGDRPVARRLRCDMDLNEPAIGT